MISEDIISDISEQEIQERIDSLKRVLDREKEEILKEVSKEIEDFFSKKTTHMREQNQDEAYDAFKLFYKACENILNVYFPLIRDQNFLALQSEHEIMSKIIQLKGSIKKNLKSLIDKSKMSRLDWERQLQRKLRQQRIPKKGRNSKTPIQSTQVLIRWLLRNFKNPYPSTSQKQMLASQSKLNVSQVSNWFINARQRVIKKYLKKDVKDQLQRKKPITSDQQQFNE